MTLHLPEHLLSAAEAMAHQEAMSVAQLVRNALAGAVGHSQRADRPDQSGATAEDFDVIDRSDSWPHASSQRPT